MNSANESAAFWEQHYAGMDARWGTKPNAVLTTLLADLAPPPRAPPWTWAAATAATHSGSPPRAGTSRPVDVSPTALDRVAAGAAATGLTDRIHPQQHDLSETFPDGAWDLVTATYFHTPRHHRPRDRPAASRPGRSTRRAADRDRARLHRPPWSWQAGQDIHYPTPPQDVIASLRLDHTWTVERGDAPQRTATGPEGRTATVTDNVIAVRRTG
ncbi:hypothetical protein GCM10020295_19210 [Streptomyces cinereospinus]